jgi:hypothetical protein
MRTALISDYEIPFHSLSWVFKTMKKNQIRFDPIVKIPGPENANIVDYLPSLKQNGYEEIKDCRPSLDKPDVIIYLVSEKKKYYEYVKRYFNQNVKILYLKINPAGVPLG